MKTKFLALLLMLSFLIALLSCGNRNDFVNWADSLPDDVQIEPVRISGIAKNEQGLTIQCDMGLASPVKSIQLPPLDLYQARFDKGTAVFYIADPTDIKSDDGLRLLLYMIYHRNNSAYYKAYIDMYDESGKTIYRMEWKDLDEKSYDVLTSVYKAEHIIGLNDPLSLTLKKSLLYGGRNQEVFLRLTGKEANASIDKEKGIIKIWTNNAEATFEGYNLFRIDGSSDGTYLYSSLPYDDEKQNFRVLIIQLINEKFNTPIPNESPDDYYVRAMVFHTDTFEYTDFYAPADQEFMDVIDAYTTYLPKPYGYRSSVNESFNEDEIDYVAVDFYNSVIFNFNTPSRIYSALSGDGELIVEKKQ